MQMDLPETFRWSGPQVVYLQIDERSGTVGWQVRIFNADEPLACSARRFPSDKAARKAGRPALMQLC